MSGATWYVTGETQRSAPTYARNDGTGKKRMKETCMKENALIDDFLRRCGLSGARTVT